MFRDKDPVFDALKTCIQIFMAVNNIKKFGTGLKILSGISGVHISTLYGWFYYTTRSARTETFMAVLHATGQTARIGKTEVGHKPKFKVIKGGKKAA